MSGTWDAPEGEGTPGLEIAKASGGTGTYQGTTAPIGLSGRIPTPDGDALRHDVDSHVLRCRHWLTNADLLAIVKDGKPSLIGDQLNGGLAQTPVSSWG